MDVNFSQIERVRNNHRTLNVDAWISYIGAYFVFAGVHERDNECYNPVKRIRIKQKIRIKNDSQ